MNIPESLKKFPQFINHDGDKIPFDPFLDGHIDHLNPSNQLTFQEAFDRALRYNLGISFVITRNDPFFFLDIDHAYENEQWSDLAISLCSYFAGCYYETSLSGTGCHIIGSLSAFPDHGCKDKASGLEFYTDKRAVALTGTHATGEPLTLADQQVAWLISTFPGFHPKPVSSTAVEWTAGPVPEWHGPVDDEKLIQKMLKSRSAAAAFGGTAGIADLWNRNVAVLAEIYPPHGSAEFDANSADQALLTHLAFWTGKDCVRMERLFGMSGLVRDKWTDRQDYRERSILNACNYTQNVYGKGASLPVEPHVAGSPVHRDPGFQFMPPETQLEYFKNCVYIGDQNKILIPNGRLLKKSQFDAQYGGWVFGLDSENDKTTKSAWDVFTMSQALNFPKVDHRVFDPRRQPNEIYSDEIGRSWVNIYIPAKTTSAPGDVSRVLKHLRLMIPDDRDREILLSYIAAVVQHPGHKFHWCPVIQGTYGNGKSLLARCVAYAVGYQYTHFPEAQELHEKFNDWILDKIFINIEEMSVSENKFQIMHKLKTLVDSERVEVRQMQTGKIMHKVCANFLMQSNHKNAVVKTRDDRRYAPIYTAQQSEKDVLAAGFGGNYFPNLYAWLKGEGEYTGQTPGYAYFTHYLRNYQIPSELNPAVSAGGLCHRAPVTSSTEEAIRESYGRAEQEVLVAIEEEVQGFRGGWISSVQLSKLFDAKNIRKPHNARREMLATLGYIPHPALGKNGRAGSVNMFDGRRPYLYINELNDAGLLTDGQKITEAYLKAQGFEVGV